MTSNWVAVVRSGHGNINVVLNVSEEVLSQTSVTHQI